MNIDSPATYVVLHPAPHNVNANGTVTALFYTERPGYVDLTFLEFLDMQGVITIHEIGGNKLAEGYGLTRVVYSIN